MSELHRFLNRILYLARTYRWMVDPRFYRAPAIRLDRPIFLLGTQGGGLTLLSRMLRRNDAVISCTGNSSYWSGSDELQNVLGLVLPREFSGIRFKVPKNPRFPPPRSWTYGCDDMLEFYRHGWEDGTLEIRRRFLRILGGLARLHGRGKEHFRFLDKSQSFSLRVGLLHYCLTGCDPRFVLLNRDPYVSIVRAAGGKAGDMWRLQDQMSRTTRLEICAQHYRNCVTAVLEDCRRHESKLKILRFEDLLSAPEETLKEICRFADLEFQSDMLPKPGQLPRGSRFPGRWYPLRRDVNQAYESEIDREAIQIVNEACGRALIETLGYRNLGR